MCGAPGHILARVCVCLWWAACAAAAAPAADFGQRFGQGGYDPALFRTTGSVRRTMRADPRGLRVTLPAPSGVKLPVGLVPRTGVRGDFVITMAFDIIRVDRPTAGGGAGVSIYVATASPTHNAALVGRVVGPGGEPAFLAMRASTPAGGKREFHGKRVPTAVLSGRLRLVRKGATVSYLVAGGADDAFKEIYQGELGTADLETVRFAADGGGSPTTVDVRIRAVSIRADDLGPARRVARPGSWPVGIVAAVAFLVAAAGGLWLWRGRRGTRPPAGRPS
jgi:hypothetical protein